MDTTAGKTTVTTAQKRRGLPFALGAQALNAFFAQITFGSSIFILYLNELGFDKSRIGFLLSLFPFAGIVAVLLGPWVASFGFKRTYLLFYGVRKLVILCLLLTPWIMHRWGAGTGFLFVTGVVVVFALCRAIAETGFYPWFQEYVPNAIRGKFNALNNVMGMLSGLAAVAIASRVIQSGEGIDRYSFLLLLGAAVGLVSVLVNAFVPGGQPLVSEKPVRTRMRELLGVVADHHFLLFLVGMGLFSLGSTVVSFLPLFLKEKAGLAAAQVVLLDSGVLLGGLLFSYAWGWVADRYGGKPVLLTCAAFMAVIPVLYLLLPRGATETFRLALLLYTLWGIAFAGYGIGSSNLLFNNVVPANRSSPYMAVWYAWSGLTLGVGPLVAGTCLDRLPEFGGQLLLLPMDKYTPVFLISAGLMLAGAIAFQRIPVAGHLSARQLVRLMFHGNPFHAVGSLIGFTTARTIFSRRQLTEKLGDARSPLVLEELLEALADPDFPVRLEAALALSRLPPNARVTDTLLNVLQAGSPELRLAAVWGLGKQGDARAAAPLRQLLQSEFPLLRAHAGRALAALGDAAGTEALRTALARETDLDVRAALVTALAQLQDHTMTSEILALLPRVAQPGTRMELALAAACLCGQSDYFLRLWREAQHDTGTAFAHAVLAWRRPLRGWLKAAPEHRHLLERASDLYAEEDFAAAAVALAELTERATAGAAPSSGQTCLAAACGYLRTGEAALRQEYALLAAVAMEATVRPGT